MDKITKKELLEIAAQTKIELLENDKPVEFTSIIEDSKWILKYDFHPDSSYVCNAIPGAYESIFGNLNDSLSVFFNIGEPNDFGNVLLNITDGAQQNLIVELLDKGTVISRRKLNEVSSAKVSFENLEPKAYNIRIIFDENKNGIWDTGNYFENIQPERIAYYSDPIDVRKGWDLDLTWEIEP